MNIIIKTEIINLETNPVLNITFDECWSINHLKLYAEFKKALYKLNNAKELKNKLLIKELNKSVKKYEKDMSELHMEFHTKRKLEEKILINNYNILYNIKLKEFNYYNYI